MIVEHDSASGTNAGVLTEASVAEGLGGASLAAGTAEQLQTWLFGVEVYIRESAEDEIRESAEDEGVLICPVSRWSQFWTRPPNYSIANKSSSSLRTGRFNKRDSFTVVRQ